MSERLRGEIAREGAERIKQEKAMSDVEKLAREALERSEKATEGPWDSFINEPIDRDGYYFAVGSRTMEVAEVKGGEEDAEFIAHARDDVPDLARAVLDLQRQLRIEKASHATRGNT